MKAGKKKELLENYKAWLIRSRSQETADLYFRRAQLFLKWAGRRNITGQLLDDYITHLADEGKSRNTLATYFNCLRPLYKHLGLLRELVDVEGPKAVVPKILCPSKEDIDRMLKVAVKPIERALLTLQFGSGVRVSELRRLKRSDLIILEDGNGELIVRSSKTRGNVEETRIPLGPGIVVELTSYLNSRDDDLEVMFPSQGGEKTSKDGLITEGTINNIYKRLCKRAGLEPITSHQLRHALTTWLLQQGVSRSDVMKICRWKSEKAMKRYDHLVPTDISNRIPDPFESSCPCCPDEEEEEEDGPDE